MVIVKFVIGGGGEFQVNFVLPLSSAVNIKAPKEFHTVAFFAIMLKQECYSLVMYSKMLMSANFVDYINTAPGIF